MRDGLKKPARSVSAGIGHFGDVKPDREIRAKTTPKHHRVERFGVPKARKPAAKPAPVSGELVSRRPSQSVDTAKTAAAPLPSMVTSVSHQKLERMLDHALAHADTHKEALKYHAARHFWQRSWLSGPRRWAAVAIVIIAVLTGLAVAWQKVPALSVKAAGMRAHLSPTVPAYRPDGFQMAGPAQAVSGTVNIKYSSSDDKTKTYQIIQAQSNLTSALVGQSVVPKGADVQTSQVDGNTVFIFGQTNDAAWVNNGVLYTIKDHARLSSDELIKIVQGLNP
jgi:hypothetical protein